MKPKIDFEQSFDAFLDRWEYDEAACALFDVVRAAYKAGWMAAGGSPPASKKVVQLVVTRKSDSE